jgi:putative transposase
LLDQFLSGTDDVAALQQGGLPDGLEKALAEQALNAGMDHHLGGEAGVGNSRKGRGRKMVLTDSGGRIGLGCRATGRAASTRD